MDVASEDLIEIDQVLAAVKGDLGILGETIYDSNIERWINVGVRQVDACDFFIKTNVFVTIECGKAKLPRGFRKLLGFRFSKNQLVTLSDGTTRTDVSCYDILYYNFTFFSDCGCNPPASSRNYIQTAEIIGDTIHFHNLPDGVDQIEMSYMGTAISNECIYLIPPDYERGLSAYCRQRFYEAYPEVKGITLSVQFKNSAQAEWAAQKGWLKAIAAKKNFDNNKQFIKNYFNAWFVRQDKIWC